MGGGEIGKQKDFGRRKGLLGECVERLVQIGRFGGVGDKNSNSGGGIGLVDVRNGVIISEEMEPVEHGEGVVENGANGVEREAAERAVEFQMDGGLSDGKTSVVDEGEEFEIEGEGLDEHSGESEGEGSAAEEFQSCLGIAEGESERELDEKGITGADNSAEERVVEAGMGVAFGADDRISACTFHHLEKGGDLFRGEIQIGVEKEDEFALALFESGSEGGAFSHIAFEEQTSDGRQFLGGKADLIGGGVRAAVVNDQDFEGDLAAGKKRMNASNVIRDDRLEIMGRHENGKGGIASNQPLKGGGCVWGGRFGAHGGGGVGR